MALTKNLKRVGCAAADERAEERERLRQMTIEYSKARFYEAVDELKRVDPDGWEAWYDDNENIPMLLLFEDWSYMKPIIQRIWDRISIVRGYK